ncbi:hypothetical protein MRX96_024942 [Rhipicephalus microplus]
MSVCLRFSVPNPPFEYNLMVAFWRIEARYVIRDVLTSSRITPRHTTRRCHGFLAVPKKDDTDEAEEENGNVPWPPANPFILKRHDGSAFSRCRKDSYSRLEFGQQVLVSSVTVHAVEESHTGSAVCRLPGGHWYTLELCEGQELNKAVLGGHVHCYHVAVLVHPDRSDSRVQQECLGYGQSGAVPERGSSRSRLVEHCPLHRRVYSKGC